MRSYFFVLILQGKIGFEVTNGVSRREAVPEVAKEGDTSERDAVE